VAPPPAPHFGRGRAPTWSMSLLEPSAESAGFEPECPACDEPLDLVQPAQDRPERILGACPECGEWYLVHSLVAAEAETEDDDGDASTLSRPRWAG
jgi:uncharacterized protein YbaR (Trm112 family)